jgi:DNA-binding MarR family transcriptional regulator
MDKSTHQIKYSCCELQDNVRESPALSHLEMGILESVRGGSRHEKAIVKDVRLAEPIVAEVITDLMFKGYIERRRRRWMLFFSREYFSITFEGLAALEAATRSDLDRIMEILKEIGQQMVDAILEEMPPLASGAIKATYRAAKFILK